MRVPASNLNPFAKALAPLNTSDPLPCLLIGPALVMSEVMMREPVSRTMSGNLMAVYKPCNGSRHAPSAQPNVANTTATGDLPTLAGDAKMGCMTAAKTKYGKN